MRVNEPYWCGVQRLRLFLATSGVRNILLGFSAFIEHRDFERISTLRYGVARLAPIEVWGVVFMLCGVAILVSLWRRWSRCLRGAVALNCGLLGMVVTGYVIAIFTLPDASTTWWPVVAFSALLAKDLIVITGPVTANVSNCER